MSNGSVRKRKRRAQSPRRLAKGWFCYLLKCADGTYYTGVALDLKERVRKHNAGRGAKYTRGRAPVRLVWSYYCGSYARARGLEAKLKSLPREFKARLVRDFLKLARDFARKGHSSR